MTKTVFNKQNIDFTKQPMFFGEDGGVQRYDEFKYPQFDKLNQTMIGYFWRPEEVSLQKDRADYQGFRPEQKHIFTSNLKYQTLLDSVQGRGEQAGPEASQDDADPEYADIWWQVDFNNFESTLPISEVGEFWKRDIVDYLRQYLETPELVNTTLANRFLGNSDVAAAAGVAGRIAADGSMMLSRLEQFLERYDLRMAPDVTVGVEPASGLVSPVRWIWVTDFANNSERVASGMWQVMFLTNAERQEYPITVNYQYDLIEEIE